MKGDKIYRCTVYIQFPVSWFFSYFGSYLLRWSLVQFIFNCCFVVIFSWLKNWKMLSFTWVRICPSPLSKSVRRILGYLL